MKPLRTTTQAHPFGRVPSLVGAALLALVLLGSPALAQVPIVDDTAGTVGGTVGDTTGSVGGTVGDTIKDTGGTVGDTTGSAGGTIGDTIKDTGNTVNDNVGGPVGGTVKDTTDKVGDAVKDTSSAVGGAVKDTSAGVGQTVDGTTGGLTDDVLGGETKGDKDPRTKKDGLGDGKKKKNRQGKGTKASTGTIGFGEGAFGFGTRIPAISLSGLEGAREIAGGQVAAFAPEPLDVGALLEAAAEAAKKFAFPIMLSILVACFMLIQDRVDRKDPKLALAAVDTDQDWLSFA